MGSYDWSRRSVRMDTTLQTDMMGTTLQTESMDTRSTLMQTFGGAPTWSNAAGGPFGHVFAAKLSSGSLHDSSVTRQRIADGCLTVPGFTPRNHPASLKPMKLLPTYKKPGRFGYEPTNLPSDKLRKSRDLCAASVR